MRCNPGEGLRPNDRPCPLTPTLSHKGRGSALPLGRVLDSNFKQRHRHCERSEAIHKAAKKEWIASRSLSSGAHSRDPLARNDVAIPDMISRSRDAARPSCARIFRPHGGRGECRMPAAPAVSCALGIGKKHTSNNEYTGITRHSRTQWFYGLLRALPGDRALLPPSPADMSCLSPVEPT